MADNLQPAGVKAVIENIDGYLRGADQMNRATAGIGKAASDAAGQTGNASQQFDKFGNAVGGAGKDADGFKTRLDAVSGSVAGLLGKLAPLGATIAGAFAIGKGIQAVDELGASIFRLQQTTNLTAEEASKLKFSFEEQGVSAGVGERAIIKFSRALGGVADLEDGIAIPTGKAMADQLYNLGIRTQDAEGKTRPLTDVIADLAEQFKDMPDGVEKTTLATNLFGRSGKDLIPLLNQGRDGIIAMGDEAEKLGLVLDQNTTNAVRANELAMKHFHAALQGISVQIGLAFLPAMTLAITVGTKLAVAFNEKIVPAIKTASGVFNFLLTKVVVAVGPVLNKVIRAVEEFAKDLVRIFSNSFQDFDLVAENIGRFPRVLQPVAIAVAYLGAAFRKSLDQIRSFVTIVKTAIAIVQAIRADITNFARILAFFPEPVQQIIIVIAQFIAQMIELGQRFGDFIGGPLGKLSTGLAGVAGGPMEKFRAIAAQLARFVIPALASAITGFIAVLAVGTVLGFATAIGGVVTAFSNLGVVKFATGLIKDFISGLLKPVKLIVDLAGNALEGLFNIGKGILGLAGKAISFTIDVIGKGVDFLIGLVQGGVQQLLNAKPLTVPVEFKTAGGPIAQPTIQPKVTIDEKQAQAAGAEAGTATANIFQSVFGGFIGGVAGVFGEKFVENFSTKVLSRISKFTKIFAGIFAPEVLGVIIAASIEVAIAKAVLKAKGAKGLTIFLTFGLIGLGIEAAVKKLIPLIVREFKDLPRQIGFILGAGVALALAGLIAYFVLIPLLFARELRKLIEFAAPIGVDIGKAIVSGIADAVKATGGALAAIPGLFKALVSGIGKIVEGIPGFFEKLPGRIVDAVKNIPRDIQFAFVELPIVIARAFTKLPGLIGDALKSLPGVIADIFTSAFSTIDDLTHGALSTILSAIANFAGGVAQGFRDAWSGANEATDGALNDVLDGAKTIMGSIRDVIVGGFTYIVGGVGALVGGMVGLVRGAFSGVKDAVLQGISAVASGVASILRHVSNALDRIGYLPGVGAAQDIIDSIVGQLESIAFDAPSNPNEPRAGQPVLPGLPGSGNPGLVGLAGGTSRPLAQATHAFVAEEGTELALLRRGRALLPAGTEVLNASSTARLLAALQGITALPRGLGQGGMNLSIPIAISGGEGIDWGRVRTEAHFALDERLSAARQQSIRAGARLGSSIG